jgi:hypothetical protein
VVEHLPSKCKALNSKSSTEKKKKAKMINFMKKILFQYGI